MTSQTGLLKGTIIELESPVPEMEGKRVLVVLEPIEEDLLSANTQSDFWTKWLESGPQGPIDDAPDTEFS